MRVIDTVVAMQQQSVSWRQPGEPIIFVPTMGALHDGHAALLQHGRTLGAKLILSIFVNPTQFGPTEDFVTYPRTLEADLEIARRCEVDAVFVPQARDIYPEGFCTTVHIDALTRVLCGAHRPGHFDGVTTVVAKLFNIVRPHIACFGEKDFQQLQVIRRMVADLAMPIDIVGVPTVRDGDGLALSSRNQHLSSEERRQALAIPRALFAARRDAMEGSLVSTIREKIEASLQAAGITRIDYIHIVDRETLHPQTILDQHSQLCIAAFAGETRLIDNIALVQHPSFR